MSSPLKQMLERAASKTNDCAEAKYVASWAEDVLDEGNDDPDAGIASMTKLIEWAKAIKLAAEQSPA
jgi:hypothetical protein